jgi:GTPase SAR1 family protein
MCAPPSIVSPISRNQRAPEDYQVAADPGLLGLAIRIDGDPGAMVLLRHLPPSSDSSAAPDIHIHAEFPRVIDLISRRFLLAANRGDLAALTVSLLLERASALLDDLYIFHGNSIADIAFDRPVLLIGNSGVGKTTITRELTKSDRFVVQAEDNLLVRTTAAKLHPYPRAASLRRSEGEVAALPPWPALGGRQTDKVIAPHVRYSRSVLSLRSATVLLLTGEPIEDQAPSQDVHESKRETFLLSSMQSQLADEIQVQFPSAMISEATAYPAPLPLLVFEAGIQGAERHRLFELLARHGAMVIHSFFGDRPRNVHRTPRPSHPIIAPVRPFDALRHMMTHEIQFAAPDIPPRDVTQAIMQLARAFQSASFHNVVPGGTPAETAAAITALLDSGKA